MVLYVDDILILSDKRKDSDWLVQNLEKRFETITVENSDKFTYLGMYVEIDKDGKYSIDMEEYIKCGKAHGGGRDEKNPQGAGRKGSV